MPARLQTLPVAASSSQQQNDQQECKCSIVSVNEMIPLAQKSLRDRLRRLIRKDERL